MSDLSSTHVHARLPLNEEEGKYYEEAALKAYLLSSFPEF